MDVCMKKIIQSLICIFLLCGLISDLLNVCSVFGKIMNLTADISETAVFRKQQLSEEGLESLKQVSQESGISKGELLAVWMPQSRFALSSSRSLTAENYALWSGYLKKYREEPYRELMASYQAIWDDLVYFPVDSEVTYEDSWMYERNYGGERGHEGTDLMPPENIRGKYPVMSITEGVVEKIGWLEKGGYRIGVRSPHGGYFYYAHLSSYGREFKVGDKVYPGELLGYMGDTGYSKIEGTTGNFDVHLHLGIYIRTAHLQELSINPYWILRYLEGYKLKYRY